MSEPEITEIQEQIIDMEGIKYRLVDLSRSGLDRKKHESWCAHCDGNAQAPPEDMDRFRIFDHFCYGHRWPLLCKPEKGLVYKKVLKGERNGS
jgi:hypothetical protein